MVFQKARPGDIFDYAIFFLILALTSLCKGLVGVIVPLIAVATDMWLQKSWKRYLRLPLFLGAIPAAIVYILPFWASNYFGGQSYGQSGLYLVYRENILRYFQPFDHQGPIYTYLYICRSTCCHGLCFLYLRFSISNPIWKTLSLNSRWISWTSLFLFLFFTLSGSRRSYYVLPMVPFAVLYTADWILSAQAKASIRKLYATGTVLLSFTLLFLAVDITQGWYYTQVGVDRFAEILKETASQTKPWGTWNVVMLDAESKLNFYLQLPPDTRHMSIKGLRTQQTAASLAERWPILNNKPGNTIFISRKLYAPFLQEFFKNYRMIEAPDLPHQLSFLKKHDINAPVAFIPVN